MTKLAKHLLMAIGVAAVLTLLTLSLTGCANSRARVISLSNREIAALDADDIVRVMRRAGFSDDQVIDLGPDLRNMLASSGAAKIQVGNKVEAIFSVDGHYLYASSYRRGSFIYDLGKRRFR